MASQRCRLIVGLLLLLIIVMVILYLTIVDPPAKPDGPICPPTPPGTLSRAHFPEGFLFGTATAAYQVQYIFFYQTLYLKIYCIYNLKSLVRMNHRS